jgi:hypothetical protein
VRNLGGLFTFIALILVLLISGAYCITEREWRFLGIPIFSLLGLVLLFALPFEDILAGFAVYQGDPSWIVRYAPELAFASFILTIAGIALSFLIPMWREAAQKKNEAQARSNEAP